MIGKESLENLVRGGGLKVEPPDRKECEAKYASASATEISSRWSHQIARSARACCAPPWIA